MITIKEACNKVLSENPGMHILKVSEKEDYYAFLTCNENGEEIFDSTSRRVYKDSGNYKELIGLYDIIKEDGYNVAPTIKEYSREEIEEIIEG